MRDFYINLYIDKPCTPLNSNAWRFPYLTYADLRWLNHNISAPAIKSAIFQMGIHKAGGSDGDYY